MPRAKRIVFSFDDSTEKKLVEVTRKAGFSSMARAVRESVSLFRLLQDYRDQGYTELIVRDPECAKEIRVAFSPLESDIL